MRWQDEGIVIWRSPFGERSMTVCFLTKEHGLHAGLVRCGNRRGELQPGNLMELKWSARLAEHLGNYQAQVKKSYAAYVLQSGQAALLALNSVAGLLKVALPERLPLPSLYARTHALLQMLAGGEWAGNGEGLQAYCLWELALLEELGYGLDLGECALGGAAEELAFISPRSGRAASYAKGADYKDKLLPLPEFLRDGRIGGAVTAGDIHAALRLSGYFLRTRIFEPLDKSLPNERLRLVEMCDG